MGDLSDLFNEIHEKQQALKLAGGDAKEDTVIRMVAMLADASLVAAKAIAILTKAITEVPTNGR